MLIQERLCETLIRAIHGYASFAHFLSYVYIVDMTAFRTVVPKKSCLRSRCIHEKAFGFLAIVCLTFRKMPANVVCVRRNPQPITRRHIMSYTPPQTKRFPASVPMNIREAVLIATQAMKRIREDAIAKEKKTPDNVLSKDEPLPSIRELTSSERMSSRHSRLQNACNS